MPLKTKILIAIIIAISLCGVSFAGKIGEIYIYDTPNGRRYYVWSALDSEEFFEINENEVIIWTSLREIRIPRDRVILYSEYPDIGRTNLNRLRKKIEEKYRK